MTLNRRIQSISRVASADLSSYRYRLVGVDSDGKIVVIENQATPFLGVLMNKPSADEREAEIAVAGATVKVEVGATITEGQLITAVAGGRGSPTTTDGDHIIGISLTPGGSAEFVEVNIAPSVHP